MKSWHMGHKAPWCHTTGFKVWTPPRLPLMKEWHEVKANSIRIMTECSIPRMSYKRYPIHSQHPPSHLECCIRSHGRSVTSSSKFVLRRFQSWQPFCPGQHGHSVAQQYCALLSLTPFILVVQLIPKPIRMCRSFCRVLCTRIRSDAADDIVSEWHVWNE